MSKTPQELYDERLKRVHDAIALRVPDRVPLIPVIEAFPMYYSGITIQEAMNEDVYKRQGRFYPLYVFFHFWLWVKWGTAAGSTLQQAQQFLFHSGEPGTDPSHIPQFVIPKST